MNFSEVPNLSEQNQFPINPSSSNSGQSFPQQQQVDSNLKNKLVR
jgi:hypothetical protein